MTNSFVNRVSKNRKNTWASNASSSFIYASQDAFADLFPHLKVTKESASNIVKPVNFKQNLSTAKSTVSSKVKNALNDLKRGKLYDPDRNDRAMLEATGMGDAMDAMDELDGLDFDDFDDDSKGSSDPFNDDADDDSSDSPKQIKKSKKVIKKNNVLIKNVLNTKAVTESIATFADAVTTVNQEGFSSVAKAIEEGATKSTDFFNDTSEKLATIANSVKQLESIMVVEAKSNINDNGTLNDLLLGNLTMAEAINKMATDQMNNLKNGQIAQMVGAVANDPLGFLTQSAMSSGIKAFDNKILGGRLGKLNTLAGQAQVRGLSYLDTMLTPENANRAGGALGNLLRKYGGRFGGSLAGKVENLGDSDIFNFLRGQLDLSTKIDNSSLTKARAAASAPAIFDQETHTTINTVLPGYLAKILSAVNGKPEIFHDYQSGRWVTASEVRKSVDAKRKNAALNDSANGIIGWNLEKIRQGGANVKDKDYNDVLYYMATHNYVTPSDFNTHYEEISSATGATPELMKAISNRFIVDPTGMAGAINTIRANLNAYNGNRESSQLTGTTMGAYAEMASFNAATGSFKGTGSFASSRDGVGSTASASSGVRSLLQQMNKKMDSYDTMISLLQEIVDLVPDNSRIDPRSNPYGETPKQFSQYVNNSSGGSSGGASNEIKATSTNAPTNRGSFGSQSPSVGGYPQGSNTGGTNSNDPSDTVMDTVGDLADGKSGSSKTSKNSKTSTTSKTGPMTSTVSTKKNGSYQQRMDQTFDNIRNRYQVDPNSRAGRTLDGLQHSMAGSKNRSTAFKRGSKYIGGRVRHKAGGIKQRIANTKAYGRMRNSKWGGRILRGSRRAGGAMKRGGRRVGGAMKRGFGRFRRSKFGRAAGFAAGMFGDAMIDQFTNPAYAQGGDMMMGGGMPMMGMPQGDSGMSPADEDLFNATLEREQAADTNPDGAKGFNSDDDGTYSGNGSKVIKATASSALLAAAARTRADDDQPAMPFMDPSMMDPAMMEQMGYDGYGNGGYGSDPIGDALDIYDTVSDVKDIFGGDKEGKGKGGKGGKGTFKERVKGKFGRMKERVKGSRFGRSKFGQKLGRGASRVKNAGSRVWRKGKLIGSTALGKTKAVGSKAYGKVMGKFGRGAKIAGKAGELGKATKVAGEAGKVGKLAGKAGKLGKYAKYGKYLGKGGKLVSEAIPGLDIAAGLTFAALDIKEGNWGAATLDGLSAVPVYGIPFDIASVLGGDKYVNMGYQAIGKHFKGTRTGKFFKGAADKTGKFVKNPGKGLNGIASKGIEGAKGAGGKLSGKLAGKASKLSGKFGKLAGMGSTALTLGSTAGKGVKAAGEAGKLAGVAGKAGKLGKLAGVAGKFGKAIPFLGTALSVGSAVSNIKQGNWGGAILDGLSMIPGIGGAAATVASVLGADKLINWGLKGAGKIFKGIGKGIKGAGKKIGSFFGFGKKKDKESEGMNKRGKKAYKNLQRKFFRGQKTPLHKHLELALALTPFGMIANMGSTFYGKMKKKGIDKQVLNDPGALAKLGMLATPFGFMFMDESSSLYNRMARFAKNFAKKLKNLGKGGGSSSSSAAGGAGSTASVEAFLKSPINADFGVDKEKMFADFKAQDNRFGGNFECQKLYDTVKSAGVSPEWFFSYDLNEGGDQFGWLNHMDKTSSDPYEDAKNVCEWIKQTANNGGEIQPGWGDSQTESHIDPDPELAKKWNQEYGTGTIGRVYIQGTAATVWELAGKWPTSGPYAGHEATPVKNCCDRINKWGGSSGGSSGGSTSMSSDTSSASSSDTSSSSSASASAPVQTDSSSGSSTGGSSSDGAAASGWAWPFSGQVDKTKFSGGQLFGKNPGGETLRQNGFHDGLDFGSATFSGDIHAVHGGTVYMIATSNDGRGTHINVRSSDGYYETYQEFGSSVKVKQGDEIKTGDVIATLTSSHLHLGISKTEIEAAQASAFSDDGTWLDPLTVIQNGGGGDGSNAGGGSASDDDPDDLEGVSEAFIRMTKATRDNIQKNIEKKYLARFTNEIKSNADYFGVQLEDGDTLSPEDLADMAMNPQGDSALSAAADAVNNAVATVSGVNMPLVNGKPATLENASRAATPIVVKGRDGKDGKDGKDAKPSETISTEELNIVKKILDKTTDIYKLLVQMLEVLVEFNGEDNPDVKALRGILDASRGTTTLTGSEVEILKEIYDRMPQGVQFRIDPLIADQVLRGW